MSFLFELFAIAVFAVLVLKPEDLPTFMRFVARVIVKMRAWRKAVDVHIEKAIRDVEVEDFKNKSYAQYADSVRKALSDVRNKF